MSYVSSSDIQGSGASSASWSHDTGSETNSLLVIAVYNADSYSPVTELTVNETSVLSSQVVISPDPGGSGGAGQADQQTVEVFAVPGVTGLAEIEVTGGGEMWAESVLLDGVDQANPIRDFDGAVGYGNDITISATVDSDDGDVVLSFLSKNSSSPVATTSDTLISQDLTSDQKSSSRAAGSSPSVTMGWHIPVGANLFGAVVALSVRAAGVASTDQELEGVESTVSAVATPGTLTATSPAIRVDDVLQDTDTGDLIAIESTEVVVLGGTAGSRTIAANPTGVEIVDGVVEIPGAYTIDDDYLVAIVEDSDRMSILPATVIDRNAD